MVFCCKTMLFKSLTLFIEIIINMNYGWVFMTKLQGCKYFELKKKYKYKKYKNDF